MADVVQFRLERMTDELDDLERRGLFTRSEIAEIVRRRRDFEYRLKRPSPLKQDFLSYIDYEKHLNSLRILRKNAIIGDLKAKERENREDSDNDDDEGKKKRNKSKKWKKSISDLAGILRILDIFRLLTVRYRGDLSLWFRYLEFCRERKHGRMKQVLAQAIRYHPKVPGLWIYAAAWEFDQNLNVSAARALMQSGLRACPESEDLWIEYLRMELTYLNKLKARKVALGEDVRTLQRDSQDAKEWIEENKDLFMPLNEEMGDPKQSEQQNGALEKTENFFWQQGALILQTIYHGAIKALPSSMSLRQRFLDVLDSVDLAHSDELRVEVMEDLKRDFSQNEEYWDWFARLQLGVALDCKSSKTEILSRMERVIQVYEEGLKVLPTVKMFSLYAKFWVDVTRPAEKDSSVTLSDIGIDIQDFYPSILKLYEKAESSGSLTEELACQYVSFHLQTGRLEEARNLVNKLCSTEFSETAKLWILRSSIEIKWLMANSSSCKKSDFESVFKLLQNALSTLPLPEAEDLWLMALKLFSDDKVHLEKLVKILVFAMGKASGSDYESCIDSTIVNLVLQRDSILQARQMYKRFLALPHPSLKFFRHCIELECNAGFLGDSSGIVNARRLYESALNIYSNNRDLWRNYYLMEIKAGKTDKATAIYCRARKVIKDDFAFLVPSDL